MESLAFYCTVHLTSQSSRDIQKTFPFEKQPGCPISTSAEAISITRLARRNYQSSNSIVHCVNGDKKVDFDAYIYNDKLIFQEKIL